MESVKLRKVRADRLRRARREVGYVSAADFARKNGFEEPAYRHHENGRNSYSIETAKRYASKLNVDWQWLMGEDPEPAEAAPANLTAFGKASETTRRGPEKDSSRNLVEAVASLNGGKAEGAELPRLPVLGMAECGPDGWSLWNGDVIDTIPRPSILAGAKDAYAVYIAGSSMEPRFFPTDAAFVHPGKPVTIGAFVLVQLKPEHEGETPKAVVKRLLKRSPNKVVLEQYNPPKTFEIRQSDIVSMHRVVGSIEA